jgi:DNA-binding transcriptional ArsR family regulator
MDTFTALADPTRRRIVESLALGETSFGDIADQFEMSRPAVSQHLKTLREAGIVTVRAEAQRRIYRLSDDGLDEIDAWLNTVRSYWNQRLDKLEQILAEQDKREETDDE